MKELFGVILGFAIILSGCICPIAGLVLLLQMAFFLVRGEYRRAAKDGIGLVVLFVVFLIACIPAIQEAREMSKRSGCQNNQHRFDLALSHYASLSRSQYPTNLTDLSAGDISADIFTCPGSGNRVGSGTMSTAMEWTDYIYVSGLGPSVPTGVPVMICPPMNHEGNRGSILDTDHHCRMCLRDEVDALIENPLLRWTNAPPEIRSNIYVHVSERITRLSKGKYRSHGLK